MKKIKILFLISFILLGMLQEKEANASVGNASLIGPGGGKITAFLSSPSGTFYAGTEQSGLWIGQLIPRASGSPLSDITQIYWLKSTPTNPCSALLPPVVLLP